MSHQLYKPDSPYEDTQSFFDRHYYIKDARPPLKLEELTPRRLGAMMETLIDALHLTLLSDDPKQDLCMHDITFFYPQKKPPTPFLPSYVLDTIGEYRAAPSYFRHDKKRVDPTAPEKQVHSTKLPDPALFGEEVHRLSRNMGTHIGQWFKKIRWEGELSPSLKKLVGEYDAKIKEYKTHMDYYGDADTFAADSDVSGPFNEEFSRIVTALKEELGKIPEFTLDVNGTPYTVSNREQMHPYFANSHPAQVLFAFRLAGKEGIDTDVHPKIGFQLLTDMLGVESDLLLIMDNLQNHMGAAIGQKLDFLGERQRQAISEFAEKEAHGLQLLYNFHKLLNYLPDLYAEPYKQIAFDDLASFLSLAGKKPELEKFENPKEVALMLYAAERRFAHENKGEEALGQKLRDYAEAISKSSDMDDMVRRFSPDMDFQRSLMRAHQLAGEDPVLGKIQALLTPLRSAAEKADLKRAGGLSRE